MTMDLLILWGKLHEIYKNLESKKEEEEYCLERSSTLGLAQNRSPLLKRGEKRLKHNYKSDKMEFTCLILSLLSSV